MTQKPNDPLAWNGNTAGGNQPQGGAFPLVSPVDPVQQVELGNMYLQLGSYAEAAAAYRKAIALDPTIAEAHFNLGNVLCEMNESAAALDAYRQAIAVRPDFVEAYYNLADTLAGNGRLDEAAASYRKAVEIQPSIGDIHNNLGTVLIELGAFDEAIASLQKAVELSPASGEAFANLGTALKHAGRMDDAVSALKQASTLLPGSADAPFNLGMALMQSGRHEEAEAAYRQAMSLAPDMPRLYPSFGSTLMALGRHQEALDLCDAYLERMPAERSVLAFKAVLLEEMGRNADAEFLADYDRLIHAIDIDVPEGYGSLDAFNTALLDHILSHPSLVVSPTSHATVKGRHTGNLLIDPKGPFADFEAVLWQAAREYRIHNPVDGGHPYLADPPDLTGLVVWSVVMETRGHQVPHIHPSGWLSGVYYADLPDIVDRDTTDHEGWIEFGAPPPDFPVTKTLHTKLFKPKLGRLFLFPSYYYHRTVPYSTDERRVSIAFDFLPPAP